MLTFSWGNLKKRTFIHIDIDFSSFTADLSMIYSFFGMEPWYKFKDSLRSSIIAILQLYSISNTLKPALNFWTQHYTKTKQKKVTDNCLLQTNRSQKFSSLYICSS